MPALTTPRLWLLPLTRAVLEARLERDTFDLMLGTPGGPRAVRFTPDWPGDGLPVFPLMLDGLEPGADEVADSFALVTRADGVAVGQLGTKGPPHAQGAVEIGYGLNPGAWGQGLATEGVGALVAHLRATPGIRIITAETAVTNRASGRVLEKLGFVRTGTGYSDEDGDLILWGLQESVDQPGI